MGFLWWVLGGAFGGPVVGSRRVVPTGAGSSAFASSLVFWRFAITDSRPCVVSSAVLAAESLSLACARESNQREHTLGVAPGAVRRVRYGRPGFCRQSVPGLRQKRRDPSRRPARCAGLIRPPFAAPQRVPDQEPSFCGMECRALLLPVPSRPRRAGAGNSPQGHAQEARAFAVSTGT